MGIAVKELKYNLCSLWTLILFAMGSLLTYSGGVEYASRGVVSAAATELGITTAAQEWAIALPLLRWAALNGCYSGSMVSGSRDRRYRFSSR